MKNWWCLLRLAVALVWLYQGLWHKIVAVDARHLEIVASAPRFLPPRLALGMLVAMNAAGIWFAGDKIPDIGGMITMNLVFALAIWGLANHESRK